MAKASNRIKWNKIESNRRDDDEMILIEFILCPNEQNCSLRLDTRKLGPQNRIWLPFMHLSFNWTLNFATTKFEGRNSNFGAKIRAAKIFEFETENYLLLLLL